MTSNFSPAQKKINELLNKFLNMGKFYDFGKAEKKEIQDIINEFSTDIFKNINSKKQVNIVGEKLQDKEEFTRKILADLDDFSENASVSHFTQILIIEKFLSYFPTPICKILYLFKEKINSIKEELYHFTGGYHDETTFADLISKTGYLLEFKKDTDNKKLSTELESKGLISSINYYHYFFHEIYRYYWKEKDKQKKEKIFKYLNQIVKIFNHFIINNNSIKLSNLYMKDNQNDLLSPEKIINSKRHFITVFISKKHKKLSSNEIYYCDYFEYYLSKPYSDIEKMHCKPLIFENLVLKNMNSKNGLKFEDYLYSINRLGFHFSNDTFLSFEGGKPQSATNLNSLKENNNEDGGAINDDDIVFEQALTPDQEIKRLKAEELSKKLKIVKKNTKTRTKTINQKNEPNLKQ